MLENRLNEVLASCPNFGALCYHVLSSWGYSRDHAECEGLFQLFHVLRKKNPQDAISYTLGTLRNKEISKSRRNLVVFTDIPLDNLLQANKSIMSEDEFRELLPEVPAFECSLLVDFYYYGFEYKEIAAKHNIPEGTVKSKIYRLCKETRWPNVE